MPDWNPRGCQKGASCSALAIGETRLRYPLKRVGARGSGSWKRIGWDEALDEIAGSLVDTLARRGGEGVVCELGGNMDFGPTFAGTLRFFHLLGAPVTDSTAHVGDLPVGGTITLGAGFTGGSSDDWFRSEYLVLWAFNPAATRIPDAHFLNEARYRGARVVSITPDYGPSAIHADLWLSPRPGTDAALALSACRVILDEGLFQAEYIREQTDLPFLVRTDTRRYLRESDVVAGGRDDRFGIWDEAANALAWAPGSPNDWSPTLELGVLRPALEYSGEVPLAAGGTAPVRSVLSLLRERLGGSHARSGVGHHRDRAGVDPSLRASLREGALGADPFQLRRVQELPLGSDPALADPARVAHREPRPCRRRLAIDRVHRHSKVSASSACTRDSASRTSCGSARARSSMPRA